MRQLAQNSTKLNPSEWIGHIKKEEIVLFNYIYYRIGCTFDKLGVGHLKHPRIACMIGMLQAFNTFSILDLFVNFENKIFATLLLISIIFIAFNLIIYNKDSYEKFAEKWKDETRAEKIIYGLLIIIYTLVTIFFSSILYYVQKS